MRVLVTGAAGFIGSWVMREFRSYGHDTVGIDKVPTDGLTQVDITDFEQVTATLENLRPEAIIHLAAISGATGKNETEQSLRQPYLNFHVNTLGTLNLCEACRSKRIQRFVYMSTFAVYGKTQEDRLPITEKTETKAEHAYGVSKLMGENIVRTYSEDFAIKSIIFRTPFVVGEYQKERNVVRELVESAMNGQELLIYGEGTHVREFIHPTDLADAFRRAIEYESPSGRSSELFVLGNKRISIRELANRIVKRAGKGSISFAKTEVDRTFDQYTDYAKIRSELKWAPRLGIDDIIDRIISTEFSQSGHSSLS
jgi:UDP-glucose 4-epimerase